MSDFIQLLYIATPFVSLIILILLCVLLIKISYLEKTVKKYDAEYRAKKRIELGDGIAESMASRTDQN
jgi:hypothetical protein